MAQEGDTITYTFSETSVSEDVSGVDEVVVDYCDAAGGKNGDNTGGSGGRVEDAVIDVTSHDTIYIWVSGTKTGNGGTFSGRYDGGAADSEDRNEYLNAGSSEISFSNTDASDSSDEPFLVAAGGGGSGFSSIFNDEFSYGGARGGTGLFDDAEGTAPPAGGDGGTSDSVNGEDGDGAIDDQTRGLVSGGTTIRGGGSSAETNGEIQLSFESALSPPTNLAVTDDTVEDELTLDWDETSNAAGYYVYRAESSGSSTADYTQVADVTSPPYTDTALEDGEKFYYRVSSHD